MHAQLCPTLCDPIDCSLPGSSVLGIFQARVLEWFVISYSRGTPDPGIEHASLVSPVKQHKYILLEFWKLESKNGSLDKGVSRAVFI